MINLEKIEEALKGADSIAWDECHKIYILMDKHQTELMKGYGYPQVITSETHTPAEMLENIKDWYANSCPLRMIDACGTEYDGNTSFTSIVSQFEDEDDEEEEEE